MADVLPSGHVRLDGLARYLQDVATDDGEDARIDRHLAWLVRKTTLVIERRPRLGERLDLATWASGTGGRWAERRTTITAGGQPVVDAAAVWVCIDLDTRRPVPLSDRFWEMYGDAVGDRKISSRLAHPDPPEDAVLQAEPWPLRATDIDVFDHVNNAAVWMPVEHLLHERKLNDRVAWAEMEYRAAIEPDAELSIAARVDDSMASLWLLAGGTVQASAVVGLVTA
jgi:acyl-ACP thioesterase